MTLVKADLVPRVKPGRYRAFARRTIEDVMAMEPGAYEVTGWPEGADPKQLQAAIRRESVIMHVSHELTAHRRAGRVYVDWRHRDDGGADDGRAAEALLG